MVQKFTLRELAAEPDVILCDEVTSVLDTVVGAAIIRTTPTRGCC